jgi:hypothetical protein
MPAARLKNLTQAVEVSSGCHCTYLTCALVSLAKGDQSGPVLLVETFALCGHTLAKKAYAWEARQPNGQMRAVVVLGVPPINSAREAVQSLVEGGPGL